MESQKTIISCLGDSRLSSYFKELAPNHEYLTFSRSLHDAKEKRGYQFNLSNETITQRSHKLPFQGTLFISLTPIRNYTKIVWEKFFDIYASNLKQIVLISTTSVYQISSGGHCDITEDAPTISDHPMIITENVVLRYFPSAIILRPSGLFDKQSHPIHYLSKKNNVFENLSGSVNLVHRKDVAHAALFLLQNQHSGIFNLSYPTNQSKADYYSSLAETMKISLGGKKNDAPKFPSKTINTKKILSLGYRFQYDINSISNQ